MAPSSRPDGSIALLLSDVDGTLVTREKRLTPASVEAVCALAAHGIAFAVTSARPPRGLRPFVESLRLTTPLCGFNSGMIVSDGSVLRQVNVAPAAARQAVAFLEAEGIDIWVFHGDDWLIRNPNGVYVEHERMTIGYDAIVVESFDPVLDAATKIVGVSDNAARLAACEAALQRLIGASASVALSQTYYLDVTSKEANKGHAVLALSDLLNIPAERIATIGDMRNDIAMFERSGFSIAMGNARDDVKAEAHATTLSNEEDGFAHAVKTLILPRAPHKKEERSAV